MSKYKLSFKSASEFLKYIEEQNIQFISCNFTALCGKWHHIDQHASSFNAQIIKNGLLIDGASIPGWEQTGAFGLLVKPDLSRASYDPFSAQKTIKIFCDLYNPEDLSVFKLNPRSVARNAQEYLKKTKIGNVAYFGSEIEFFVFGDPMYVKENSCPKKNDSKYLNESPLDGLSDIRAEMLSVIESMGVSIETHHHASVSEQCALAVRYTRLLEASDNILLLKHAVHNVANSYGKSATFMPKPMDNIKTSTMHLHQSIWKDGKPVFAGEEYAGISDLALYYIGGILKHVNSLSAFANPTTNSYKRSVFSDPCRIPYAQSDSAKRIETSFSDPAANPYLLFPALLMAGLDGIENKIHPDTEHPLKASRSLQESLDSLKKDCAFLLKGDVFTKDIIEAYIALKEKDVERHTRTVHPVELEMYYAC